METVRIEFKATSAGEDFKLDESAITVLKEDEAPAKALVQAVYDAVDKIDNLQGQVDRLKGEAEILRQDAVVGPEQLDAMVKDRQTTLEVAAHAGLKPDELKADSVDQIKRKVVVTRIDLKADASEEFILGCFDMIRKDADKVDANKAKLARLGTDASGHVDEADQRKLDEDNMTYRQRAMLKTRDLHMKTDEDIHRDGIAVN